MRKYETMVVLEPELTEEQRNTIIKRIEDIIAATGEFESLDEWGMRKLAYTIHKKYKEGYYLLFHFKGNKELLDNLEHYYRITDSIIRSIIVNKEKRK